MKLTGILSAYCVCCAVALSAYADADFDKAAKLLSAAKNANIQQVQSLISSGANVNYVDPTGLSLVCTALMNNDTRAFQILQMYGADASQCDIQIKQYKNRTTVKGSDGVFGGLSTPQTLTLAAGGAALVGGGVALVAGVFNPSNNNGDAGGGSRPDSGGGGGGSGDNLKPAFTIPYGPAYLKDGKLDKNNYKKTYEENLMSWDTSKGSALRVSDFNYFRPYKDLETIDGDKANTKANTFVDDGILLPIQNYLLMMHGYSPLAAGYMGFQIFRDDSLVPQIVKNDADGGKPVSVALITNNGINPVGSAGRGDGILYASGISQDAATFLVDKYLNFENPTIEKGLGKEKDGFDFSGAGTAMNPWVSNTDNALAKIVAGWEKDRISSVGDFYGFVPNARLAIYRIGDGKVFKDKTGTVVQATLSKVGGTESVVQVGDEIKLGEYQYKISAPGGGTEYKINGKKYIAPKGGTVLLGTCESCSDATKYIALYKGTDDFYYINTTGGDNADYVYSLKYEQGNYNFYQAKELPQEKLPQEKLPTESKLFTALDAAKSNVDVLANLTLNPDSKTHNYFDISEMDEIAHKESKPKDAYQQLINKYYSDGEGQIANNLFLGYSNDNPIIIMPAGESEYGSGDGQTTKALLATFENYAPVLYGDTLDHNFMTIVAVQHNEDTIRDVDTIAGYGNGTGYGEIKLSVWENKTEKFQSRICGAAGFKNGSTDPWCFAAAGPTAEMATASAAGAVAAVKGAFGNKVLSNDQIFTLLALTADGAYLGTNPKEGKAFASEDALVEYLDIMYELPYDYQQQVDRGVMKYLDAFKTVFGYGLINLERATTPGKSIYYYDGTRIVSVNNDKNAYWRAASNTAFNLTGPFGARGATISAPFYDVLTSVDGEMSLPRIWENEITLGSDSVHALYMGDVLGDLKTRKDSAQKTKIGNVSLSMAISDRPYADNLGGLDNLGFAYENDRFNLSADFQRYFTDGQSRFTGMANPILSLSANTISTGADYKVGNFFVGGRAFSGNITDEAFLQNDPTISSQYQSLSLGVAQGAMSQFGWNNKKLSLVGSVGFMHESNTVLGAQTDGLLGIGNGNTTYFDMLARYDVTDNVSLSLRSTFAQTKTAPTGMFINDVSDLNSNAFAFGANLGNFEFTVSRPLAIRNGALRYAYADYDIVDNGNGKYDLSVSGAGLRDLSLAPDVRETRFSGTYRHSFGEFTDGALGFIYRINPNNTNQFGNESIFMLKLTHRLGI